MNDPMPKGGVKELLKTSDGRAYLARLQKKYEIDLIQPGDPRFKKVYGDRIQKQQERLAQQTHRAQEEWVELKEKKNFVKKII